jgi:hypothetical protein
MPGLHEKEEKKMGDKKKQKIFIVDEPVFFIAHRKLVVNSCRYCGSSKVAIAERCVSKKENEYREFYVFCEECKIPGFISGDKYVAIDDWNTFGYSKENLNDE